MPILCSSNANALALGILLKTHPIVLKTTGPIMNPLLENELRPQSRVDARNIRMAMPAAAWLK